MLTLCGDRLYCSSGDVNIIDHFENREQVNSSLLTLNPNTANPDETGLIVDSSVTKTDIIDDRKEFLTDSALVINATDNIKPIILYSFTNRLTTAVVISGLVIFSIIIVIIAFFIGFKVYRGRGFQFEIRREFAPYRDIKIPNYDLQSGGEDGVIRQIMSAHNISYDEVAVLLSLSKKANK